MRSNKRKKYRFGFDNYWESAAYNDQLFYCYRDQIINLALSRFKWINLPKTCNERYLEFVLLTQGMATIAYPKKQKGIFYSTQAVQDGRLNIYDNPTKWRSIGINGWQFGASNSSGVIVYDNLTRFPLIPKINLLAREFVDIMMTARMNRQHQKMPYVLTGSQEKELDMINLYKQIAGGEPAVIANKSFDQIKVDTINTQVPFIGDQLYTQILNTWQQVYQLLGISAMPFKQERQIEDEVKNLDDSTNIVKLSSLKCRREACEKLNSRFSEYLEKPIEVVWAQDNTSENYNFLRNIKEQVDMDFIDSDRN